MSITLQPSAIAAENQSESAFIQSALLWLTNAAVFPPPVLIADIRAALETGQPVGYLTDAAFNQYLQRIYDFPVVDASLTVAERTIFNDIRAYLEPAPRNVCCGAALPTALNTSTAQNKRTGTASFEYDLRVKAASDVTCDAVEVEVTITPGAGVPPVATVSPVVCNLLGCVDGSTNFSKLWVDFVGNPTGGNYDLVAKFKDKSGATIATVNYAVVWT